MILNLHTVIVSCDVCGVGEVACVCRRYSDTRDVVVVDGVWRVEWDVLEVIDQSPLDFVDYHPLVWISEYWCANVVHKIPWEHIFIEKLH